MDLIKHLAVFDPRKLAGVLTVVGCGALGSAVVLQLAKLGCTPMLFDHDLVEPHNIANQILFGPDQVGRTKVDAAIDSVYALTGLRLHGIRTRVQFKSQLEGCKYVFVCVDSMEQRKAIAALTFCAGIDLLVEGRMGARAGAVYSVDPNDQVQMREYRKELYDDADVIHERAACQTIQSVGATASTIANFMVWSFINHVMGNGGPNEVIISHDPVSLSSRKFQSVNSVAHATNP